MRDHLPVRVGLMPLPSRRRPCRDRAGNVHEPDGPLRYFRLAVFPIAVPPLRDRPEDIAPLVRAIVDEVGRKMDKNIEAIEENSLERLRHYQWPGNIRELRNIIERAIILGAGPLLQIELPDCSRDPWDGSRRPPSSICRQPRSSRGWRSSASGVLTERAAFDRPPSSRGRRGGLDARAGLELGADTIDPAGEAPRLWRLAQFGARWQAASPSMQHDAVGDHVRRPAVIQALRITARRSSGEELWIGDS